MGPKGEWGPRGDVLGTEEGWKEPRSGCTCIIGPAFLPSSLVTLCVWHHVMFSNVQEDFILDIFVEICFCQESEPAPSHFPVLS